MTQRPLSPHLSIWKWGPHMLVSILHRVTGDGMALVGLPVLVWWLAALASGPGAYATFTDWMWTDLGALDFGGFGASVASVVKLLLRLVMIGVSWAFFNHLVSGLRHFVMDIGAGYELTINKSFSVLSPVLGIVLTVAFWALLLWR